MPVSSWVLTLTNEARRSLPPVLFDDRVMVGRLAGERLPVVVDSLSLEEEREIVEAMKDAAGVLKLELVFVDYRDLALCESAHPGGAEPTPREACVTEVV